MRRRDTKPEDRATSSTGSLLHRRAAAPASQGANFGDRIAAVGRIRHHPIRSGPRVRPSGRPRTGSGRNPGRRPLFPARAGLAGVTRSGWDLSEVIH